MPFFKRYFNVYCFDLKGFGKNSGMEYPYSLDDYIEEVKKFVSDNGIKKPSVIAHSFGGRIAIKLAAQNPDFFDKIVLTGAAGLKPKTTVKKSVKKALFRIVKPFLGNRKPKFFYSSDYLRCDEVMKESFRLIINEHLDSYLDKIKNPVMIIYGEKDKETPVYMAKRLRKNIKGSELTIIKDAGHFCFIDKPLKFNTEVREFLLS